MRLLASLAVVVASLAASPALAQGRSPMRAAVLVGFEDGNGPAGLALRFDGELEQRPLSPGVGFSLVGSIGYSHFSDDGGYYDYYGYDNTWETTTGVFKIIPAARFTFGRSQALRPYVDAGLGLYYASWGYTASETFYDPYTYPYYFTGQVEYDDSEVGVLLRLAAGLTFQVSPGLALGAEIGFTPYLGDFADDSTMNLMFAAQFRL
jgi:hypothetical protein